MLLFLLTLNAEVISGDTLRQYSKPGAPIDMIFTAQKVDVNEISDVNITLKTIRSGTVSVLITLDENLKSQAKFDENITYQIMPEQQDYKVNLKVKSEKQGLYYIRLLTKVDNGYGIKLRSFAIPIYVGKAEAILTKGLNFQMKARGSGENISVSKAVETIEVVKE